MLAVSPLRDATRNHGEKQQEGEAERGATTTTTFEGMGFSELGDASLLDSIDFDDLFIGISDGDVLPDLEMDSEILAEFSDDYSDLNAALSSQEDKAGSEAEDKLSASELSGGEVEIVSKREARARAKDGGRKESKNCQGKRKVKVDWTPDLHRRFVQAVEQLGMDKAVPSRILEIMGIDCLTRHNIASHLQKYRSHRKHLLAREAEAANWSQRRQMYAKSPPWPPTMGFPPVPPAAPQPPAPHHFRPLHVWGHPTVDRSLVHAWPPNPPRPAASYWHSHHERVPNALTPRTPFFPQPLPAPPRLIPPPVAAPYAHASLPAGHGPGPGPHPFFDFLPTKESIDAAIGDVISKPWLPLPLGLKPPSTDSVMTELQRQGVPKVPPSCA